MDIDELLSAATSRQAGSGSASLQVTLERVIRQRLRCRQVTVVAAPPNYAVADTNHATVRVAIPGHQGDSGRVLVVRLEASEALTDSDRRFLERVAAVYALATAPGCTPRGPTADDTLVRDGAAPLIGHSLAMQTLRDRIAKIAATDFTVLVEGESGTGKELVARHIHELSRRHRGPFVAVNCAAIVETLLEAELFGIEDRTATGVRGRRGKFELASGGTMFLDEIADLSTAGQAKLLRAIQDLAVERVGGTQARRVDIRIIAATNRRLRSLVERGGFRQDLYYRLSGVELFVPPLRTRREDIPELVRYFLQRHRALRPLEVSPSAADALAAYDWPGNVRELERLVESALTLASGSAIDVDDLPAALRSPSAETLFVSAQQHESLREWSRRYVSLVYQRCGENKREACRVLGISYHTLRAHLRCQAWALSEVERSGSPRISREPAMSHVHERSDYVATEPQVPTPAASG